MAQLVEMESQNGQLTWRLDFKLLALTNNNEYILSKEIVVLQLSKFK